MLPLCSAVQPLELLSGYSLLAAASILFTLVGNSLCAASCMLPDLSVMQRMSILTMVHAIVLNTVPLCCRNIMPAWMLRACIAISALASTVAGYGVLSAGDAAVVPSQLLPHMLISGILPLALSMVDLEPIVMEEAYAKSLKSD